MYSQKMMVTGAIMVLAAIAILAFSLFMIGEDDDFIKKAVRFDGGTAGAAKQGDLVIAEGKVSAKNRILKHDFVDAAKEYDDNDGGWAIQEEYRQPIIADLARGEIVLTSDLVCTRSKGNDILKTDEKTASGRKIRYEGLKRGDPITAVGTLTSLAPAALAVKDWYSGSAADYKDYQSSSRMGGFIFFAVLAGLGAGLFLWGLKRG